MIFDTRNKTWTSGPVMGTARAMHGCFSIEENGTITKVVAMGGKPNGNFALSKAEILDVASLRWQRLPDLPFEVRYNQGVESMIGPYLGFSIAGSSSWPSHWMTEKRIIGLRKYRNGSYYWEILNNHLSSKREFFSAVNAPISMLPTY